MKSGAGRKSKAETIDEFLARLSPDKRAALQRLRKDIRAAIPGAEECISYGVPAFRLDGNLVTAFGAGAHHCAFYPGAVVALFQDDLQGYDTSKGTIRFQPDHPLPAGLVRKLVRAQLARRAERPALSRRKAARAARPSKSSRRRTS